jgi:hypothetical protein
MISQLELKGQHDTAGYSCPNQSGNGTGFILLENTFLDLSSNCTELTSRTFSTQMVSNPDGRCVGPSSVTFTFADTDANGMPFSGSGLLYLSYYHTLNSVTCRVQVLSHITDGNQNIAATSGVTVTQ